MPRSNGVAAQGIYTCKRETHRLLRGDGRCRSGNLARRLHRDSPESARLLQTLQGCQHTAKVSVVKPPLERSRNVKQPSALHWERDLPYSSSVPVHQAQLLLYHQPRLSTSSQLPGRYASMTAVYFPPGAGRRWWVGRQVASISSAKRASSP